MATIQQLLAEARETVLPMRNDMLGIELLLAEVLEVSRERLLMDSDVEVPGEVQQRFTRLARRFVAGEPVEQIIGRKEFYGRTFGVNEHVLIPRPETELLVERVLAFVDERAESMRKMHVLDVGTGCGNIVVSIAAEILAKRGRGVLEKDFSFTAVDVSKRALQVAAENAKKHGVGEAIDFVESNLLTRASGPFDVIVANLPYIGTERFRFVSKEAFDYEPHVALFGGEMGLELYEQLFAQLDKALWKPKFLLGEFGFLQGDEMRELLSKFFTHDEWEIEKDYASIERIFTVHCES